jgi:large subunit ribosomal protein L21e
MLEMGGRAGGHSKGLHSRSRKLLKLNPRERGKITLSKILYNYKDGEKVVVKINPSVQKGMPHRRFQGRTGVIITKRGRSYVVHVQDHTVTKEIIVRPEHLKPRGD